jgi:hypothetical protein
MKQSNREHWLTDNLAKKLIASAEASSKLDPPRAAGGNPDAGPLESVFVQVCQCGTHFSLVVDGAHTDEIIESPEDLVRAVLAAEARKIRLVN